MTKSAELNHLSRPAISQAIQKLEEELGVELVVHQRRGFELTSAGIELAKRGDLLLEQTRLLKQDVKTDNAVRGEFRIGAARTLASFALQNSLQKLKKEFPLVDFKLRLYNSETLIEMLSRRDLDVAFFLGDETLHGYKQVVVGRGSYVLVKPRSSPSGLRYALTESRPETERAQILFERQNASELPVFTEVNSWDAIWAWVQAGVCGGLIPDFMLRLHPAQAKNLTLVIPKVFPYEAKVLYHKTRSHDLVTVAFLETLKALKF